MVAAPGEWLAAHGVELLGRHRIRCRCGCRPDHEGFSARSNRAARAAGLRLRPWTETLRDTLEDERRRGLTRERKAGLGAETEQKVLAAYRAQYV